MKLQGDRKKYSEPHHLGAKYSGLGKSRHGQNFKDKRQAVPERAISQRSNDEPCPSQHLWVGNVSTSVTKTFLAEQFSRFGDVECVKLFSSKNYAFVSLKTVEDAVYAKKGLHGTVFGGLAIRIEFARGDSRMSNQPHGNEKMMSERERQTEEKIIFQDKGQKDGAIALQEKKPVLVNSVNSEDESRQSFEIPKGNRKCDSSEVLWIGFPLHLKIDEKKLHKLFAPFGGVEKITTFPGRTYAFVRFQNVKAASRAKDALQGKLFDDPRVSISFAKSEVGPIDHYQAISENHPSSPMKVQMGTRPVSSSLLGRKEEGAIFPSALSATMEVESSNYSALPRKEEVLPKIAALSNFGNLTSLRNDKQISIDSQWSASPFLTVGPGRGRNEKPCSPPNPCVQPKLIADFKGDFLENAGCNHGPKLEINEGIPVFQKEGFPERKNVRSEERWMLHEEYGGKRDQKRGRLEIEHPTSGTLSSLVSPFRNIDNSLVPVDNGEAKRQRLGDEHFWGEGTSISRVDPDYADQNTYLHSHETWDGMKVQKTGLLGRTPPSSNNEEMSISLGSEDNRENNEGSHRGLLGSMPLPDSNLDQPVGFKNEHGLVESPISPAPTGVESPTCPPPKDVFRWEGTIAKGGMEVCRCRCFPATKEIDVMFPDILNCTARTSLDMLANYISQVKEFAVVLFMPQGVPDVAPYQELMAFLADKQRAAVCKLSEENTLFLVPPSDFVEQFLNVPKSNNILGVVLGQQQNQIQPSSTLTEHNIFSQPKQTFVVDDLKKQSYQKLDVHASTEDHGTSHFSTEMKTTQPSSSQQIGYQLSQTEGSGADPGLPASFQNFFGKNLVGHDKSQDHDMVIDNSRMPYQTQGSNSMPVEYQARENNPLSDIQNVPYQILGNNSMPHGLHMFGGSTISHGSKLVPHQDSSRPPLMFFPPQSSTSSEQLSVPGSTQMAVDSSQKLFGSFPFHEQPWSAPFTVPQSAPSTQLNSSLAHLQQSFTYGSTHSQQQFPTFDGGQRDGQGQSSNFIFESVGSTGRNMILPYPPALEYGPRPPGPPPGPPLRDASLPPPGPAPGPLPAPLIQDREKQGVETEQHQALQMALAGIQGQEGSDEDQKKFRATVELAAALLQQLQQQTKM